MRRVSLQPRPNWEKRLEDAGCFYHTIDGKPYWREDAAYVFSLAEIDKIEAATNELHKMCIDHCTEVVARGDYTGYGFPDEVKQLVAESWGRVPEDSLFGRFDLGYDGANLKLYEYNADTPTGLPEAAVWQWHAAIDRGWGPKGENQFNSIHEHLVERWKKIATPGETAHFAASQEAHHEDWGNVNYLIETAAEAGYDCTALCIDELGWSEADKSFADLKGNIITHLFKLYPWEVMMQEKDGWKVREVGDRCTFIEPAWKMLLSTKALLPLLWKKHPGHPLLLEAHFEKDERGVWGDRIDGGEWVRKPLLGREGANITKVSLGSPHWSAQNAPNFNPQYDKHGYIVQRQFDSLKFDGEGGEFAPVIGSWVVGDEACGIGIREDTGPVTTNASCFVPHYFEP